MYSKDASRVLGQKGIAVGDRIRLVKDGKTIEGTLMPRSELGDQDVLVIKLDNGYNIGVNVKATSSVERLSGPAMKAPLPKSDLHPKKGLDKVKLLYTGGTIGSKIDYATGGVYMLTKPEELLYDVPELAGIANIDIEHLMSIASEDITSTEWQAIARSVAKAFDSGAKGVVVTIGTDTMHYSSAALSFMVQNLPGPVVLTGAQRSSDRGSSDGFMNLICATHLASSSDIAEVGICMHATSSDSFCNFMRGTKVRKLHTSSRDAFKPVNSTPIARVNSQGRIDYLSTYEKADGKRKAKLMEKFEEKVALVMPYPNSDPAIVKHYVDKGYKGMIIAATGMGHLPISTSHKEYNWFDSVKDAIASGVIVGITSQCLFGRVSGTVYRYGRMLTEAGAIYCEDMLPETAYVKLGFLLGNYKKKEAEKMLASNLVGEITDRTLVEWQ